MITLKFGDKKLSINKIIIVIFFISSFFQNHILFASTSINDIFKVLGVVLSIINIVMDRKIALRSFVVEIIGIILFAYTSYATQNYSYFIIFLMIIACRRITIREYIELSSKCILVELVVAIILWIVSRIYYIGIPRHYAQTRISFGLGHPNQCAVLIIWWWISVCILRRNEDNTKLFLRTILVTIVGYLVTESSTFIFLIVFIVLLMCGNNSSVRNIVNVLAQFAFFAGGVLTYIFQYLYGKFLYGSNSLIGYVINYLSNYRVSMSFLALRDNGLTALGQVITTGHEMGMYGIGYGNYTIDMLYTYLFVCIGFVYFLFISCFFYELGKRGNYWISLCILIFTLYGFAELHCIYLTNCFVPAFFKVLLYKDKVIEI